jgi:hypothetical protein
MPLPIRDGNQSLTTLSTILVSNAHIPAHTVISFGTQGITDIATAVSGVELGPNTLNALENITVTLGQVTITGGLTDAQLRASAVTIGGGVYLADAQSVIGASIPPEVIQIGGKSLADSKLYPIAVDSNGVQSIIGAVTASISGTPSVTFTQASVTFGTAVVTGSTSILNFPATQTVTFSQSSVTFGTAVITGSTSIIGTPSVTFSQASVTFNNPIIATDDIGNSALLKVDAGSGALRVYQSGTQVVNGTVTANLSSSNLNSVTIGVRGTISAGISSYGTPPLFQVAVVSNGINTVCASTVNFGINSGLIDVESSPAGSLLLFNLTVNSVSGAYKLETRTTDNTAGFDSPLTIFGTDIQTNTICQSGLYVMRRQAGDDSYYSRLRFTYLNGTGSFFGYKVSSVLDQYLGTSRPIYGSVTASISGTPSITFGTAVITGSASILNFPATQAVTFSQAPVTFGLISGTVTANPTGTQTIAGTVTANVVSSPSLVGGGYSNFQDLIGNNSFSVYGNVDIESINSALPTGTNRIGVVTIGNIQRDGDGVQTSLLTEVGSGYLLNRSFLGAGTAQIGSVTIGNTVTIANIQGTVVTTSNFTSLTPSTVLAGFNASREVLTIFNEGAGNLHISVGTTCTTLSYQVRLSAGDYYEAPLNQASITHSAVFATAGTARVTQVS